jgi:bacteriorhodopsin
MIAAQITESQVADPNITLIVVVIALIVVIAANTVLEVHSKKEYKWWYGAIKIAFYFGSFALTMATGGATTAIASVSTFLGMELSKLTQLLHINGIQGIIGNGNGARKSDKANTNTPQY